MLKSAGIFALGAVLASVLIYATPLKWYNIIPTSTKDIDAAEFNTLFSENPEKYVFIDVRDANVYEQLHAKGAISEPIGLLFEGHNSLPKSGKQIVLICSSGRLAGVAYGYLEHEGFTNLLRIKGGMQDWVLEKLPVEGVDPKAPIPAVD